MYGVKTLIWYPSCFAFKRTPLLLRGFLRLVVDPVQWEICGINSCGERRYRAVERYRSINFVGINTERGGELVL